MPLSLSADRATGQDPLNGCADKSSIYYMLHLLMTGQVRAKDVKPCGEGHDETDETAHKSPILVCS